MRPPADTAERPLVLIWEVTQACELACEHCRADAQSARHPDGRLSTAEGKALLDDVGEFGDGQLVVLSGGDPMKRPRPGGPGGLRDGPGTPDDADPSGTDELTTDAIDDLADAGLRRMAVSLDGATAESHDAFRGESGSFEQTLRAARDAADAGLPLQINSTVCGQTVEELPAIADLVEEMGAVLWSVFFLVPVGRGAVLDPISPERAERVMEWLQDVSDERPFGVKTTEAPHYRRVGIERRREASDGDGSEETAARTRHEAPCRHRRRRRLRLRESHGRGVPLRFPAEIGGERPRGRRGRGVPEPKLFESLRDRGSPGRGSAARVSSRTSAAGAVLVRLLRRGIRWRATHCVGTFPRATTARCWWTASTPHRAREDVHSRHAARGCWGGGPSAISAS